MAIPTPLNSQITDSVVQSNLSVLGSAPAMAMGSIYQSIGHSTGILYQNSVQAQQQAAIAGLAATNQGVIQLYSVNSMSSAAATSKINNSDTATLLLTLIVALKALK